MGNYLKMADKQRILALLELGWSYRRIERETGVRRETVSRYDPRRTAKAANLSAGPGSKPAKVSTGPGSAAESYRAVIEAAVARGFTAQRIWQDLREQYGYGHGYASVKRFVRRLKRERPEVADVLEHPPGQEAQVDFFQGRPTFDLERGRWPAPLDLPDDPLLLAPRLCRAHVAAGPELLPAGPRACLRVLWRRAQGGPPRQPQGRHRPRLPVRP